MLDKALKQLSDLILASKRSLASAVFSTTNFTRTIKQEIVDTDKGPAIKSTMDSYAYYQDSGVRGAGNNTIGANPNSENTPGQFTGNFKMIGGNLPFGARRKIYKQGLRPKPFIKESIVSPVESKGLNLIAMATAETVADTIGNTFNK